MTPELDQLKRCFPRAESSLRRCLMTTPDRSFRCSSYRAEGDSHIGSTQRTVKMAREAWFGMLEKNRACMISAGAHPSLRAARTD